MLQSYTLTYRIFDGGTTNTTSVTINLTQKNLYPPVVEPLSLVAPAVEEKSDSSAPHYMGVVGFVHRTLRFFMLNVKCRLLPAILMMSLPY
jgi:hypothetical protein